MNRLTKSTAAASLGIAMLISGCQSANQKTTGSTPAPIPSIASFCQRAQNGDALNVVFFGGSLTWGANASNPNLTSYRGLIMQKLRDQYPHARWNFIDAAIGGTGSQLGIYRVDRDVLKYHPDLVFLDFTLNDDATKTNDDALAAYEGIVRRILTLGQCPIIPVFLVSKSYVTMPDIQSLKRRTSHIQLCQHYGLLYADVMQDMRNEYQTGHLDLNKVWPPELFDNTHPHDYGYGIYAKHVWLAVEAAARTQQTITVPDKWFYQPTYAHIVRFKISDLPQLPKGWKIGYPETRAGTFDFLSSRWQDNEVIAANCDRIGNDKFKLNGTVPEPLKIKFYGTNVSLFGEATIWTGKYQVVVDNQKPVVVDVSKWAQNFTPGAYDSRVIATGLNPETLHTLVITPLFDAAKPQIVKLESICVAGPQRAEIVK